MCFSLKKMFGFEELKEEAEAIKKGVRDALKSETVATHTFTVQKPFCCPASPLIRQALQPYGVKVLGMGDDKTVKISVAHYAQLTRIELKRMENLRYGPAAVAWLPLAIQCEVTVKKAQAEWAEYLIERTKRMCVVRGNINSKNRDWANQHNGQMPRPWIERSCKQGNDVWSQVNEINKQADAEQTGKGKPKKAKR